MQKDAKKANKQKKQKMQKKQMQTQAIFFLPNPPNSPNPKTHNPGTPAAANPRCMYLLTSTGGIPLSTICGTMQTASSRMVITASR